MSKSKKRMDRKELKEGVMKWVRIKLLLTFCALTIISLIYISFVLMPTDQGENEAPKLFSKYRPLAQWITIFLTSNELSFIDAEEINNQAILTYDRADGLSQGINMFVDVEVTIVRADGTVLKVINGEWVPVE